MVRYIIISVIVLTVALRTSATPYEALIDSADNYTRMERWDDAERIYNEALRLYPASPLNPMIFSNLGVCQSNLGKWDDAIRSFDIALIKSPDNVRILCAKATASMMAGNDSTAFSALDRAILCDSIAPLPRRIRGKLFLATGDMPRALQDFTVLESTDPSDEWGPGGIGEVYLATQREAEAVPMLRKALALKEDPDFRISLISALLSANMLAEADDSIRESLSIYPETGEFYLMRGILHRKFHLNTEAEYDIKIAKKYGVDPQIIERYLPRLTK